MKPVLTPQEAVELDRATQAGGVPAEALMERAGRAVARAAVDLTGGSYGRRAVVVCGKGNNGGDGFVAARHLARWGMAVTVVTVEDPDDLREPAAGNHRRLAETAARVRPFAVASLGRELARADVAVDAIFGTGFRGVPEDEWGEAIEVLNASPAPVVAVDIPSGVNGTTGAVDGAAVWAALTVTFGAAKTGAMLLPGAERAGDVRVVDIGFPEALVPRARMLAEPADVVAAVPEREPDAHKKASGTLVVVAGSRGMTGAVRLIARAASRIGAGYVIVAVPRSVLATVQAGLTEAVFLPLDETQDGTVAASARDAVLAAAGEADAVALGPGLTTHPETAAFVRGLVGDAPVPLVIDADGLNAFAGDAEALASRGDDAVLTPHLGELARLVGPGAGADDRLGAAHGLATRARAVALVKGTRSVIADPDGRAAINPTGSSFLATAGTGDVLTGIIGGLLARGVEAFEAAWAGAYLHGVAGILAGRSLGDGAVAGDVAERLPDALATVREQAET
jgi:ADP-dependent NAD(P)H-hydrate dehydratase / NAD(P)H-hydrate epimerase